MEFTRDFSTIPPQVEELAKLSVANSIIDPALYQQYNVKRGLRDRDGKGVLTGLTEISEVWGHQVIDGVDTEIDGILRYRGYNVEDLIKGFPKNNNFSFEEVVYLLMFGQLPTAEQFAEFKELMAGYRTLPIHFVRDIIMKAPSKDMMNTLARSVLTLYSYDQNSDDNSPENVLRQCLELIALFPQLSVYGYQTYKYYHDGDSFFIHPPLEEYSTAENILHMLRMDSSFSSLEAKVLDMALVLHAEHGGGNNSTFTTHVVTSSGTDTYSSTAAALGSLKGPRHGGANIKVIQQMAEMKETVSDWTDEEEVAAYLGRLLNREAFDKAGLIYGLGHAIYTKSDPRARMLKEFVRRLSAEKGREDEFALYETVERIGPALVSGKRNTQKSICANVDFYSGFAYDMLGLPRELYTPIFAIARIAGWSAHRMEEIINRGKIIRPAYMSICPPRDYVPFDER
ncbi:MAG: citrate/2-methylcitrate synthase [Clostridia bacterium]|nr:citrate/2-methylcitrate synthase [Clostridia bacterium]